MPSGQSHISVLLTPPSCGGEIPGFFQVPEHGLGEGLDTVWGLGTVQVNDSADPDSSSLCPYLLVPDLKAHTPLRYFWASPD